MTEKASSHNTLAEPVVSEDHDRPVTVVIMGASLSNTNLGVCALGVSAIKGALMAFPNARVLIHHYADDLSIKINMMGREVVAEAMWLRLGNSVRDRYDVKHLNWLLRLKRLLPFGFVRRWLFKNRTLKQLSEIDVALDVSGGDSFANIYGPTVFKKQVLAKTFMMDLRIPVVLLPQTYGPFDDEQSRRIAKEVISSCALVATREEHGVKELGELCGDRLASGVVCCPDMAFLMDPDPGKADREPFLRNKSNGEILVALNVSGLLYLAKSNLRMKDSYSDLIGMIVDWVLAKPNTKLLLVPHVIAAEPLGDDPASWESFSKGDVSDTVACKIVMQKIPEEHRARVGCLGWPYTTEETKYFVGCSDFMIGARMHSCIAGISQTVPTATLAYSKKAAGLMGNLGVGDTVVDLRELSNEQAIEQIDRLYESRGEIRCKLEQTIPEAKAKIADFFTEDLRGAVSAICHKDEVAKQR